ncbi:hypothetical protein BG015_001777 [Linnemannia schmuckeri]|uniref:Uncharacterized protein n=1 Tax=Linnemannia schmuckeri TaxID=64567 RepID=A0A9P5RPW0_9FUNG|nr:hypothetical protein BG015_001777 [Linnemannia schmuckeri]
MFSTTPIGFRDAIKIKADTSDANQSPTSPMSRRSSKSSSSSASSPSLLFPDSSQMRAADGAQAAVISGDDGAFARMQIREDGTAQDQDDVAMFYHHSYSQSHFGSDQQEQGEGEGEGEDGDDSQHDHDYNEDGIALREDQVPVKKRKSL